jgi:hypothetical protein
MSESKCGLQRDREGNCYNEDCMCDPCECTVENPCECCNLPIHDLEGCPDVHKLYVKE